MIDNSITISITYLSSENSDLTGIISEWFDLVQDNAGMREFLVIWYRYLQDFVRLSAHWLFSDVILIIYWKRNIFVS